MLARVCPSLLDGVFRGRPRVLAGGGGEADVLAVGESALLDERGDIGGDDIGSASSDEEEARSRRVRTRGLTTRDGVLPAGERLRFRKTTVAAVVRGLVRGVAVVRGLVRGLVRGVAAAGVRVTTETAVQHTVQHMKINTKSLATYNATK